MMTSRLSGSFSAMGFALVSGIGLTAALMLVIVLLSANRELPARELPPVVVELMTWRQPAVPMEAEPPPKAVVQPEPVPQPEKKLPEPLPVVREENTPAPEPPPPMAEPEPVVQLPPEPSPEENEVPAPVPVPVAESPPSVPQPPPEIMPVPVPIFRLTEMPRFVHRETPVYPDSMRSLGKAGIVQLEALIDHTGRVRNVTIVESAGEAFDQAARAAIMRSTFTPGKVDDRPVTVLLRLPVKFRLL